MSDEDSPSSSVRRNGTRAPRVLIFNIYFHPEPTGTGLVVGQLAADLVRLGHEVTVVTTVPHYGFDSVPQEYRGRFLCDERWEGVRVVRTGVRNWSRKGMIARIVNYLGYALLAVPAGLRATRPDVVLCVWPPVTTGLAARLVSWWRRAPLVLNVQDVYPDAIFKGRLMPRVIGAVERWLLRSATRVTVLSEGLRHEVARRGAGRERIDCIPMWTDVEGIRPVEKNNKFRARHGLEGKFVVLYSGNIGTYSGVGAAIEMAALLHDEARVRFVVVGRGNGKEALLRLAVGKRVSNVTFLDTCPREELEEMLGAADISLVTLDPRIAQTSVPSKAFTIMASGRPILAAMNPENEVARIVTSTGCGWCTPADQPLELSNRVRAALSAPSALHDMGMRGRRYVERFHGRALLTAQHAQVLAKVIEGAQMKGRKQ